MAMLTTMSCINRRANVPANLHSQTIVDMDKAERGPRSLSKFCQVIGLLVLTLVIFSTCYYTAKFTRSAICEEEGNKVLSGKLSTAPSRNSSQTPTFTSCNCAPELIEPLSHDQAAINEAKKKRDRALSTTLEEAFFERMRSVDVSQAPKKLSTAAATSFKSRFLPNKNFMNFPILAMENVCIDPTGVLLLIGTNSKELDANVSGPASIPELYNTWADIYAGNPNDHCTGINFTDNLPENYTYFQGTTAHLLPYIGNSFHNFAERIWPFIMASSPPFKFTVPYPIDNYIIHRFEKWLSKSKSSMNHEQLLWQFRMLMEISGNQDPTYLITRNQSFPVCFQRLLLQHHQRDRMDQTRLPMEIAGPGVRKYRDATFAFFKMEPPQVILPPSKLRVVYYGRNDASRRSVVNSEEVISFLSNSTRPPLEVRVLDEMLRSGKTNYSFPQVLKIFSETDLLVIAHGSTTWPTFLLPEGAAVVEIFGPCNWMAWNHTDIRVMHTWIRVNAAAAKLKLDISNPFREAIANPKRGNTTLCMDPFRGVPDYTVDIIRLGKIINSFGYPDWPDDHLTQHWLYNWTTGQRCL